MLYSIWCDLHFMYWTYVVSWRMFNEKARPFRPCPDWVLRRVASWTGDFPEDAKLAEDELARREVERAWQTTYGARK